MEQELLTFVVVVTVEYVCSYLAPAVKVYEVNADSSVLTKSRLVVAAETKVNQGKVGNDG